MDKRVQRVGNAACLGGISHTRSASFNLYESFTNDSLTVTSCARLFLIYSTFVLPYDIILNIYKIITLLIIGNFHCTITDIMRVNYEIKKNSQNIILLSMHIRTCIFIRLLQVHKASYPNTR